MAVQLKLKNFRCLRTVDWSPNGVCVLVGPNGSGKTTLFDSLDFLRIAFETNPQNALAVKGGVFLRNLDASTSDSVSFSLTQDKSAWEMEMIGPLFNASWAERVRQGSEVIIETRPGEQWYEYQGQKVSKQFTALRTLANMAGQMDSSGAMMFGMGGMMPGGMMPGMGTPGMGMAGRGGMPGRGLGQHAIAQSPDDHRNLPPLIRTVLGYRLYETYALDQLRQGGSPFSTDMRLSLNGVNAFTVLRNWRDKRDYQPAYEFVVDQISKAFPGVADGIEFDFAAQVNGLSLSNLRWAQTIPVALASKGWLAGLLHLMAVAGADKSTVVAIDEFENSLHPYAIRRLVQGMRQWAADKDLTVLLTGHSSALLDEFREYPSQVFVMEPSQSPQESMPIRLTDYHDPEWLKQFSLGELYRHETFGAPNDTPPETAQATSAS